MTNEEFDIDNRRTAAYRKGHDTGQVWLLNGVRLEKRWMNGTVVVFIKINRSELTRE